MAKLYQNVDAAQLQRDADECLLTYGTDFHPEIITNAEGRSITTASGHRMLDWTRYLAALKWCNSLSLT
jgi:hypothetical protein